MGLSLKKLGNVADAIGRQLNPLDNGKTAKNPLGNAPAQAASGAPAPSAFQQLTHNGVTNTVGDIVKPVPQFVLDFNNTFANLGNRAAGRPDQTIEQNEGTDPVSRSLIKNSGATGKNSQLAATAAQIALTAVAPGVDNAAEQATTKILPKVVPAVVSKIAPKVVGNAAIGAGFNAASAVGEGASPEQVVKSGAEGAALGGALPVAGEALRKLPTAVKSLPKITVKTTPVPDNYGLSSAAEPTKVAFKEAADSGKVAAQTPTAIVAAPDEVPTSVAPQPLAQPAASIAVRKVPAANTGIPFVDKAINDVAAEYTTPKNYTGQIGDVAEQVSGNERLASRLSTKLGATLKKALTPEENQAVEDFLDGNATTGLTANALKVANALRPLREQGFDVRSAIKPDIGKVVDYSPRISTPSVRGAIASAKASANKTLGTRFDLESGLSEARTNDKFISNKSTLVGNPTKLGLKDQGNGVFKDAKGTVFKKAHATKAELETAGLGPYARRTSTVNRVYHADTLGLKARGDAVNELKANPSDHGLYTQKQVDNGVAPDGVQEVTGVKGLEGLYASEKDAKTIQSKLGFTGKSTPAPLRAFDAVTNAATQAIVLNPIFHGMNQLYQTAIAAGNLPGLKGLPGHGMASVLHSLATVGEDDMRNVLKAGAGGSDYGANMENMLSKLTGGATKVNSKAMAAIELRLRAALYKSSVEKGMTSVDAAKNINAFLGDTKHVNESVRRAFLFAHYFKTMTKAIGKQVAHPIEQRGSIVNAATMAALTAAVSYGYSKFTGNPNANVRVSGELGLIKQAVGSGEDFAHGDTLGGLSIATNRLNPVVKEAGEQVMNKDLFTGQPVDNTAKVAIAGHTIIPGGATGHAIQSLIAPAQQVEKGAAGSRSASELAANELGLNTPHAKGYKAAPSGNANFLNTKGSITSATGDPTGEKQQQAYFNNLATLKKQFKGDTSTTDSLNKYLDRSHDPATGQSIQNSPEASKDNAAALATNSKLLSGVQKFEQSQPSHDPMWDLPANKLATLMTYKAQLEGSAEKSNILSTAQNGSDNWITDIQNKSNAFYDNLPKTPGSKGTEANSATPPYPTFDPQTTTLMATYNAATPAQKTVLEQNYSGEISNAFNQIAQWTNKMRVAQTGKDTPQIRSYPEADAATQAIINTYDALPKGNGPNGTSPNRSAWITANPDAYAKMQNYLTSTSLNSLISNAAKAQFAGTEPDQQLLKDISNVGQYDIATTAQPDGSNLYSVNPAAAYSANNLTSSDSYASSGSAYKDARYLSNQAKFVVKASSGKVKAASVKLKKPKLTKGFKVAKSASKGKKVSLKPIA